MNRNLTISSDEFEEMERYLLQQMPGEELAMFEQKLATDPSLKDKLQQMQLLMTGIKEAALKEKLNGFHEALPVIDKAPAKSNLIVMKRWLVAASVLLILALGSWWLLIKKSRNEKLYAQYFQPDPGLMTAMGSTDNYAFDRAMVDYKTGNYPAAITAWKTLQQKAPDSDTLNFFVGAALLADGKASEATDYLQKVAALQKSYFQKDACWYTGLALIDQNKPAEAAPFIRLSDRPERMVLLEELNK